MPKPKQFLRENKKKPSKHGPQVPETAEEYLAAGVASEEAGEKWRAGDAAKSTRFFVRAIELYEEALKKFPHSFDLAYNKARVQYELTQHPKLLARLPGTLLDLLKTALDSSRFALSLQQDNADVLFNTAQVLTSLVEALDRSSEDALRLLEEAIELFQRCLTLQEYQYSESQAQQDAVSEMEIPDSEATASQTTEATEIPDSDATDLQLSQEEERWATIVEPVTNDTLLDTVLAQLEALTTLCSLVTGDEGRGLSWIEEYFVTLNEKLSAYIKDTDRQDEAALTKANFVSALADANFRSQRMDGATYQRALEDAFRALDLSNDPEGLCDQAEALLAYNTSVRLQADSQLTPSRWKALTAALEYLTAASKIPSADNLAKIHLTRGDAELLRYQLGQPPTSYAAAAKNGATLLKNASTFYRGAEAHATASKSDEEFKEATIKIALTENLGGDGEKLRELLKMEPAACQEVLEDAVDDGLVTIEWLVHEGIGQ